jgi:hypothetical protein
MQEYRSLKQGYDNNEYPLLTKNEDESKVNSKRNPKSQSNTKGPNKAKNDHASEDDNINNKKNNKNKDIVVDQ